jgi:hypothetical protein
MADWIYSSPPQPKLWTLLGLISFFYKLFLFNYIIKIDVYKIEHQPKNTLIWDNYHHRKQTKINHVIYFSINLILKDEVN